MNQPGMRIRIGIFDDHPVILNGLSTEISAQGYDIVFCTGNVHELFEHLTTHPPDVLILDVVAPNVTGIELFEKVAKTNPSIQIIAYTSLGSVLLIDNLLKAGIKGYVNKNEPLTNLLQAINQVAQGEICLPPEYRFLLKDSQASPPLTLSTREIEILKLITQEYSSKEIAEMLFISVNTVENHRKNIFAKLQVKNLAGLIVAATANGYLS
jgi:DNA-binding NarL/FixJ family response regulator